MVRTILKVTTLLLMMSLYCAGAGKAYAWFHHSAKLEDFPVFERTVLDKSLAGRYVILPNKGNTGGGLRENKLAGGATSVTAVELDIDIPFNLLTTMMVNTEGLLDRRIAANLKVKNLLEEYLAAKKRNAELLKDLSIPYLDGNNRTKKKMASSVSEAVEPAYEIKKKLADVILFQKKGKEKLPIQKSLDFQAAWYGKKTEGMNAVPNGERLSSALENGYARRPGRYTTTYGHETQLPWIFAFGLKLLRSVIENRIAILAWTAVMVMAGLIGMLVVKR